DGGAAVGILRERPAHELHPLLLCQARRGAGRGSGPAREIPSRGGGMTGGDLLCDTLLVNGINVCFANPGTSEMASVAALDRKRQMRSILGLFEGVVTGAADGYGRMTG